VLLIIVFLRPLLNQFQNKIYCTHTYQIVKQNLSMLIFTWKLATNYY